MLQEQRLNETRLAAPTGQRLELLARHPLGSNTNVSRDGLCCLNG